jgi:hypothetical protein
MSDSHFLDHRDGVVSSDIAKLTIDYLTWLVVQEFFTCIQVTLQVQIMSL